MGKRKITAFGAAVVELFQHDLGTWNITAIRRVIEKNPDAYGPHIHPISPAHIDKLVQDGTVDLFRPLNLPVHEIRKPIISIRTPHDTLLIVDGNHRYVARWLKGDTLVETYVFPWEEAQAYRVDGLK